VAAAALHFRQPKIQHLRSRLGQHDVARLQIAVHNTVAMGVVQCAGNLDGIAQCLIQRQGSFLQPLREVLTIQMLHHQEIDAILVADIIERTNVWVT
jgi:hypothetical protein